MCCAPPSVAFVVMWPLPRLRLSHDLLQWTGLTSPSFTCSSEVEYVTCWILWKLLCLYQRSLLLNLKSRFINWQLLCILCIWMRRRSQIKNHTFGLMTDICCISYILFALHPNVLTVNTKLNYNRDRAAISQLLFLFVFLFKPVKRCQSGAEALTDGAGF